MQILVHFYLCISKKSSTLGLRLAVNYSPFRQRFSPINGDNLIPEIPFLAARARLSRIYVQTTIF